MCEAEVTGLDCKYVQKEYGRAIAYQWKYHSFGLLMIEEELAMRPFHGILN